MCLFFCADLCKGICRKAAHRPRTSREKSLPYSIAQTCAKEMPQSGAQAARGRGGEVFPYSIEQA